MSFEPSFSLILKYSYLRWKTDRVSRLAAALSYFSLFSLLPFFLLFLTISGMFFGDSIASQEIFTNLSGIMGNETAGFVQDTIRNFNSYSHSFTSSIILILIMFFGLTSVYLEMQSAFHFVWRIRDFQNSFTESFFSRSKGFFALVIFAGLLSLHISIKFYVMEIKQWLSVNHPSIRILDSLLRDIFLFVFIWVLLSIMFKFIAHAKITWKDVLTGSGTACLLLWVSKVFVIRLLTNNRIVGFFGGGGSIILFMIWIYVCMLIILFGAEVTYVNAKCLGRPIQTKKVLPPGVPK